MPEKISIPPASELLETIRTTNQLREKFPNKIWSVQPKFDGSKCVLIPTREGYIATTGGGNKIECLADKLKLVDAQMSDIPFEERPVFESEIEPDPWTQENKVKLNGNLYKQGALPFKIALSVFDCITQHDFNNQSSAQEVFCNGSNGRVENLMRIKNKLIEAGISVSRHESMTTEQVADLMDKGVELGRSKNRVIWDQLEVEGLVIRDPESKFCGGKRTAQAIKLKPFVSLDLQVVVTAKKANGMAALGCIDTKEPTQPFYLFTGLPKRIQQDPNSMLGKIVEVEILTTDDIKKGMGNPTYKNDRPDKSFDQEIDPSTLALIRQKLEAAGMIVAGELNQDMGPEL